MFNEPLQLHPSAVWCQQPADIGFTRASLLETVARESGENEIISQFVRVRNQYNGLKDTKIIQYGAKDRPETASLKLVWLHAGGNKAHRIWESESKQ